MRKGEAPAACFGRRALTGGALAGLLASATQFAHTRSAWGAVPDIRLGTLQFGTVQWVAQLIRDDKLDAKNGFALEMVTLANNDAGRIALMAGAADVVVSDWIFVAHQRAAGTRLKFAPFSDSTGGLMVPAGSPIRSLADLAHTKLGVAGGPVDKSWLITRAAARTRAGIDPASAADIVYGAPPLLNAKLLQGELNAVLTFWNFAARLEAAGCRQVISVADCARALGISGPLSLVGFVFHEVWAAANPARIDGLLAAAAQAENMLATSDVAWQRIRKLMNAPDEALFANLKRRFIEGIAHPSPDAEQASAEKLFAVLLRTGGPAATAGLERLPDGIFWRSPDG